MLNQIRSYVSELRRALDIIDIIDISCLMFDFKSSINDLC